MSTITKIKDFYSEKLNSYEFAYFSTEFLALVQATTAEKLHVASSVVDKLAADTALFTDFTQQTRISDETAKIADVDKQTDDLIVAIFDTVRSNKKSPLAARKTAATELYNVLKPYTGCYQLAQRQEVQAVRGMLTDLAKEKAAAHVATLGLDDLVEALTESVEQYAALLTQREEGKAENVGMSKKVRASLVEQYDYITTVAFAFSVAEPSEELDNFIQKTNLLIDSANRAYNLRTGTKGGKDEDPTVSNPEEPEPVTPAITAVYQKEGGDPENPHRIGRDEQTMVEYQGFTLKGADGTLEHVVALINDQDYPEWIKPATITNVTENSFEFTMVPDLTEGQYKVRIETYDGGSPLIVEYPEMITIG